MKLTENALVADRYRLVKQLGEGGMGAVWFAEHISLKTPCALKFIHADVAQAAEIRARFEREAVIAAQLRSPNVVQVLDYGIYEGTPYLAMEYLAGEDLGDRLEKRGRLSPYETASIIGQVARALTKAHAASLIHRDLKPENIYLVPDDDVEIAKVLDFGIAKSQSPLTGDGATKTGTLLGTPHYMSPEQAQGTKTIDHRSDLFSLGVVTYRCLVGALPFDSTALGDLLMQIIVHPLPVPTQVAPGLPPSFDAWWARAAARSPDERFQSAKEMADALSAALGISASTSVPSHPHAFAATALPTPGQAMMTPAGGFAPAAHVPAVTPHGMTPPPFAMVSHPSSPSVVTAPSGTTLPSTMSPASRTYSGPAPAKGGKVAIVAAMLGLMLGGGALALVLFRGDPAPAAPEVLSAVATEPAAEPTEAPEAEPEAAPSAEPSASASASAEAAPAAAPEAKAPAAAPAAAAKPPAATAAAAPAQTHAPASATPAPASTPKRTGKVVLPPPPPR